MFHKSYQGTFLEDKLSRFKKHIKNFMKVIETISQSEKIIRNLQKKEDLIIFIQHEWIIKTSICNQMVRICKLSYYRNFIKKSLNALAKVSGWKSFLVNQNYSDSFRCPYPSQCESFRTNPKNVQYIVCWKTVKNQSDLIRLIPRHQSEWIRTNPKSSFQSKSIRINPNSDWSKPNFQSETIRIIPTLDSFRLFLIENSVWINPSSDWSGLKTWFRIGSEWFALPRIQILEWIGTVLIDSEWISIRYLRQGGKSDFWKIFFWKFGKYNSRR